MTSAEAFAEGTSEPLGEALLGKPVICCARWRAPLTTVFETDALSTVIPGDGDPVRQGTWAFTRETRSVTHSGVRGSPNWIEVVVAESVPRIVIHPDDLLPDAVTNIPGHSAGAAVSTGLMARIRHELGATRSWERPVPIAGPRTPSGFFLKQWYLPSWYSS
jgi:hypothetical protein